MVSLRHTLAPAWLSVWQAGRALVPGPAGAFRILLFHDVPPAERPAFAALVRDLHAAGRLISPKQAEDMLSGTNPSRRGPPPCLLSFDDGFASNVQVAQDILDPLDVKALFFLCPGLMDLDGDRQGQAITANIFDGKRTAGDLRLMSWRQAETLRDKGHVLGAHTRDHLRLTRLDAAGLAEQVGEGARLLAQRLGQVPPWFAFTFGDVNSVDAAALAEISRHHRYCRSGVRGLNSAKTHPLALRADHVELAAPLAWRRMGTEGALDPLYRRQRHQLDQLARMARGEKL